MQQHPGPPIHLRRRCHPASPASDLYNDSTQYTPRPPYSRIWSVLLCLFPHSSLPLCAHTCTEYYRSPSLTRNQHILIPPQGSLQPHTAERRRIHTTSSRPRPNSGSYP
ncbi:hypothetical protein BD779DRAFT_379901 [Infundibulicybe gibba]|nr:hypothetical protein BD779DRAFT_379901 [Infundibulicybe gibba]